MATTDRDEVARFLSRFPERQRPPGHWRARMTHWWDENPAQPAEWPHGWVIDAGDHIGGFLGCIATPLRVGETTALGASATTWWVAADHRRLSLKLMARFLGVPSIAH